MKAFSFKISQVKLWQALLKDQFFGKQAHMLRYDCTCKNFDSEIYFELPIVNSFFYVKFRKNSFLNDRTISKALMIFERYQASPWDLILQEYHNIFLCELLLSDVCLEKLRMANF